MIEALLGIAGGLGVFFFGYFIGRAEERENEVPCCYGGIAHDCHAGHGCKIVERIKTHNGIKVDA